MKPKFLVVDDDQDILNMMAGMFDALGCEPILADNGARALEFLDSAEKAKGYDAVFLDIMMPGLSGLDVLRALKDAEHTKALPIIMLTAKGSGEEIIEGYQLGADYYIPKPFTMDQVVYGLDVVFGRTDESKQDPEEEPPKKVPVHRLDFDPDGVN